MDAYVIEKFDMESNENPEFFGVFDMGNILLAPLLIPTSKIDTSAESI